MRRLVVLPEAAEDLRSAFVWYEQRREGLGDSFSQAVEAALSRVRRQPESFKTVADRFHAAPVRRFPYQLFYSFDDERVTVLMAFHTSRDPNAILRRMRGR